MPTVSCPSCGRALEVDDAYRDWTVRCPHCATEFVPADVAPAPYEADDRDDDYYDDRPRRRRRRDPDRDAWEREEAIRRVHGPGTWLEICGWLGGLLLAGGAVLRIGAAVVLANNPPPNAPPNQIAELVFGGVMSGLGALPYTVVMVVGGRKMRALSGYGWAMTASVVAISSFFLCPCVCVCAFPPVGFGIWGVVTLSNPLVRRAFEDRAREYRAPARRDWDDND